MPSALILDALIGEPPAGVHPVVAYGRWMHFVEELLWTDTFFGGLRYALVGSLVPVLAGRALVALIGGLAGESVAGAASVALRSLVEHAREVADALEEGDLATARASVSKIVGRDTAELSEAGVARAAIESLAENFNDAVAASLVSLNFGGAPGALGHRGVNTMDATVGHRSSAYASFGTAAARFDDVVGLVPARLGALALCAVSPAATWATYSKARREARAHPSPNAGLMEACVAHGLGLRLGGTVSYAGEVSRRPGFGPDVEPEAADIGRAIRLAERAAVLLVGWLMAIDGALWAAGAVFSRVSRSGAKTQETR